MIPFLIKSRVAAHMRQEPTGKLTLVKEHVNKVQKKATVTQLPDLKQIGEKLSITHRMAKFREPRILDHPVIETKGGKTVARIIETHHVVKKTAPVKWSVGAEVKYKREGKDAYVRNGLLVRETANSWFIQPKRNNRGENDIIKLDKKKDTLLSTQEYKKKQEQRSTDETKTGEGDRLMARNNLTAEELIRRKTVVEERLGFSEDRIVSHPSFIGPAIKIVSELANQNNISTAMLAKPTAALWHQAADANYQEMLFHYAQGAIKAWRRELANPIEIGGKRVPDAAQTENNLSEFKEVLAGTRHSSYTHFVMEKEGKSAAIRWLKEFRNQRDMMHDQDINDMAEDPEARRMLGEKSSQPMQLKYTLHVNQETLKDDIQKVVNKLGPVEREVIRIKFGFPPYKEPVDSNQEVAAVLNKKGVLDPEKNKWTRNTIGVLIRGAVAKLASDATKDELSYHMDEAMGRPVWKSFAGAVVAMLTKSLEADDLEKSVLIEEPLTRIPKDFHPEGLFKAGDIEYEVIHEGDDAVLVKGGSFDELFEMVAQTANDELLIKAVAEELFQALEAEA
jgi:hypothetical protein